ncbi:uncharacterized protein [Musca autumnalis]|uniref:uncharacterized protein n=1 Tax=Musca autumnalis TaxID=221902 RepID=UPI003CF74617
MENCDETYKKKCNKRTTNAQFQKLVDLMELYPQLATGRPVFGSNKLQVDKQWDDVAVSLNAMGPPERTSSEWRKTWADLKSRTKQNIAENKKCLKGTGGGPCRLKTLSPLELQVDKICQLSTAAAPDGNVFGIETPCPDEIICEMDKDIIECFSPLSDINGTIDAVKTPTDQNFSEQSFTQEMKPKRKWSRKRCFSESNDDKEDNQMKLLRQQVKSQEHILQAINIQAESSKIIADSIKAQNEILQNLVESVKVIAKTIETICHNLQ